MTTLYELTQDFKKAQIELEELDDAQCAIDTLEALKMPLEEKALNVAKVIRNMDGDIDAIKDAIKQMQARVKSLENKRDSVTRYLKDNMEAAGISKLSCPYFELAIVKNPAKVVILDDEAVPDEYKKVKEVVTVDKTAIKQVLKDGELPFARLEQTTRLRIK